MCHMQREVVKVRQNVKNKSSHWPAEWPVSVLNDDMFDYLIIITCELTHKQHFNDVAS